MKAKCITFAYHKGGTGKTTSCINIAGELTKKGKKVLVVDMDPQGNATSGLRINKKHLPFSLHDALFDKCHNKNKTSLRDVILSTEIDNLHLAPADLDLAGLLTSMHHAEDITRILDHTLEDVRELYDYILIDTPPSYTFLLINAIVAADSLILPIDTGYFSMESIETFTDIIKNIEKKLGIRKPIDTVIITQFPEPTLHKICKKITQKIPQISRILPFEDPLKNLEEKLRMHLTIGTKFNGDLFTVPYSHEIYAAQRKGQPVPHYTSNTKIKKAYDGITQKIMSDINVRHTKIN